MAQTAKIQDVVTYNSVYLQGVCVDTCRRHEPRCGVQVSHGAHKGECDVCEHLRTHPGATLEDAAEALRVAL